MSLGKQPFDLPVNAVKKETSIQDKILIQSHNENMDVVFYDKIVDSRIHTKSVKVKFFIVGFRQYEINEIQYIGKWVELEPYQLEYYNKAPAQTYPAYFLGFYPYLVADANELHIRFQLFPFPNNDVRSEIYIEKLTVIDSDFDSELSWLTDTTIPPIYPPITGPIDPPIPPPIITNPNCVWPF